MRDFSRQAQKALEVYLNRGAQALESAKAGDVDSVNNLLAMRRAAFHNFRVADVIAARYGQVRRDSEEAFALWKKIRDIDLLLAEEIQGIKVNLASQVARFKENRRKMNLYKSGKSKSAQLETPV